MKISCKTCQALLEQFIMDDLSAADSEALQTHLDHCTQCQQVLEGEAWEQVLKDLPKYRCPDRVIRRIDTMIQSEKQRHRAFGVFHWHWRQTAIAGVALAMTLAIFIMRSGNSPTLDQVQYTDQDVEKAQEIMKWTMMYTAQKIKQSETMVMEEAFTKHLSRSVQKSVRKVLPILKGESS